MEQAVEDVGRFVRRRGDHPDMIGSVLVGDVRVEAKTRVDTIAGVHLAGHVTPLARAEELTVGTGGGALAPHGGDRQCVMGVNDPGEGGLVGVVAEVGVGGPDQLVTRDALAGLGHAGEAQVGGIGEDGGQQRILIRAGLAGPQIGEGGQEAGAARRLVQEFGHSDAGHQGVEPIRERVGLGRGDGSDRADVQTPVPQFHPVQSPPFETVRKASQPPIQLALPHLEPGIGRDRQVQAAGDRLRLLRRHHVAVEAAIAGRALDPHVAGTELVAQVGQDRGLVHLPVDPAFGVLHQTAPLLLERHRRVARDLASPTGIHVAHQLHGGDRPVAGLRRPELDRLEEGGEELAEAGMPVGGPDERIGSGHVGDLAQLLPDLEELGPADGLVQGLHRIALGLLRLAQGIDRAPEHQHQTADVTCGGRKTAGLRVHPPGERLPDQPIGHAERGINQARFQVDQQSHGRGSATGCRVALDQVGGRQPPFAGQPGQPVRVNRRRGAGRYPDLTHDGQLDQDRPDIVGFGRGRDAPQFGEAHRFRRRVDRDEAIEPRDLSRVEAGEQGLMAALAGPRAPGDTDALDRQWGRQGDLGTSQGVDDRHADHQALVRGPCCSRCGVHHQRQVGPRRRTQPEGRRHGTGMVRHRLLAGSVVVETRCRQLQLLCDEADERRHVDIGSSEDLAERQAGMAHEGELDRKAEAVPVFAPPLDQGEITRSETVAPGQGVALDRDAEELGTLVGAQEIASAHGPSPTVHGRSKPIKDAKA